MNRRAFRPLVSQLEHRSNPTLFTVTNPADSGPGSLRQVVLNANASPGLDTIGFDPSAFSTPQTITLGGELLVTGPLTVAGPGANLATVNANG